MKDYPIKGFGSKLMVASKSINNIPNEFLSYSRNARIYDGGIGPRKGKQLLTNSTLGTNNKGGFVMNNILYQITNSNIYSVNTTTGVQTLVTALGYDNITDILVYGVDIAIITSNGQSLKVFNGTTVTTPATVPATNTGMVEYCRGFSFLTSSNVLYISRPILPATPSLAYDFTGSGSQTITFNTNITGLKGTMNGLYIFTEDQVHFLGANSLQNVSGSASFISTPLGDSAGPINNLCIAGSGDKIFYITKTLQVQTVNYTPGIAQSQIGELSSRPVVNIKEFLNTLNPTQSSSFGFYNETDKTIQFHLRSIGSPFNDYVLVYDLINDTWNVDTNKNYNYVVKKDYQYYGFSDINSNIYLDDVGNSDNNNPIEFKIRTNNIIIGPNKTMFGGFYIKGGIGNLTDLNIDVNIDNNDIFNDVISGSNFAIQPLGEIAGSEIGEIFGGDLNYFPKLNAFDKRATQGRIYRLGMRIQYEITSNSQIQDFILDMIGTSAEPTSYTDLGNKF